MQLSNPLIRFACLLVLFTGLSAGTVLAEGKIEPPVPVRTAAPRVPREFTDAGKTGLVTVNFAVDEQGSVHDAKILKTTADILDKPALEAVLKWKFKPAKKDGQPYAMRVTIPIKFDVE
jgi:protein TonB